MVIGVSLGVSLGFCLVFQLGFLGCCFSVLVRLWWFVLVFWFKQYLFNNTLINRATPYVKIAVVHVCTVHLVHTR